jgi:hypothetical protein
MDHDAVSFAKALGEHMASLLLRVLAMGVFDAPVYMTVMTRFRPRSSSGLGGQLKTGH